MDLIIGSEYESAGNPEVMTIIGSLGTFRLRSKRYCPQGTRVSMSLLSHAVGCRKTNEAVTSVVTSS